MFGIRSRFEISRFFSNNLGLAKAQFFLNNLFIYIYRELFATLPQGKMSVTPSWLLILNMNFKEMWHTVVFL